MLFRSSCDRFSLSFPRTVTLPLLVGCLYCLWSPRVVTRIHPASSSIFMTSLTLYRFIKHHFKRCKGSNNSTNRRKKSLFFCFFCKKIISKKALGYSFTLFIRCIFLKRGVNINNVFCRKRVKTLRIFFVFL